MSSRPDINNPISNFFQSNFQTQNQQIFLPELEKKNIQLFIKREDEIHPEVSGNKFRKLKYNLQEAYQKKQKTLLTFGGAFSNHILATAVAGKLENLKTIGVIRGNELGKDILKTLGSNPTLQKASDNGMKFEFISRKQYREKTNPDLLLNLKDTYGDFYLVPEGGTNELAIRGCEEILTKEDAQFNYICCCVGTGGTISGLIRRSLNSQKILGFPALKGNFLQNEIQQFVGDKNNWQLITQYHFGGYGKYTKELIHFINQFKEVTKIPLDPIYTGKMLFGILDMIKNNQFTEGAKILLIHTGGLQGIEGFNERLEKKGTDLKIYT